MGRINFADDLAPALQRGDSFPKLSLEVGAKARIAILENPEMAWVHSLNEPEILNGKGIRVERERKDGSKYPDWKDKYVGSFQCLGDAEVMDQQGVDSKNCPACDAALQLDKFRKAAPKYALNIIKYNTKQGSAEVTKPFSVTSEIWTFGPAKFEEIRNIVRDGGHDLRKIDLILGPCENKKFQKFNIMVAMEAEWTLDDNRKALTTETYKENRIEDLSKVLAPVKDRASVEALIERVKRGWDTVNGAKVLSSTDQLVAQAGSDIELPDLSVSNDVTPAEDFESASGTMSFDDLLGSL